MFSIRFILFWILIQVRYSAGKSGTAGVGLFN
jgi:hypothetical protein